MRRITRASIAVGFFTVTLTLIATILVLNYVNFSPRINRPLDTDFSVNEPLFIRTLESLLGPGFTEGNSVTPLRNGDEIFPAMLSAIRQAEYTINFETFVYWTGSIADIFAEALAERARNGVQVRILLDAVGSSRMDEALIDLMVDAGAVVERFRTVRWYNMDRLNHRTHRKLLIADGKVGFTGGVGIGDEWLGDAQDENHWRETHFEFRGPVVAQLQAGFADHWMMARQEIIQGYEFFPKLKPEGEIMAQAFNSSAEGGAESIRTLFLVSIAAAKETVYIGTPYFVPDDFLLDTLLEARLRGVEIEVLTQGEHGDSAITQAVSTAKWGDLLKAGVRIYKFDPTLYHTKVLIVDERWVSIGSANFDNRSFLFNDENNVNILNREFAAEMLSQFEKDKARSSEVSFQEWLDRPWYERVLEWVSSTIESQV
ncbi:MAG: phospholipase D-like domain-containing protein [Pseudohongiellaceae bacterium]